MSNVTELEHCLAESRRFLEEYWRGRVNASGYSSGDVMWLAEWLQDQRNLARGAALRDVVGRIIGAMP